jgi:formylglycine-generating enzyme required for sulfatase activity
VISVSDQQLSSAQTQLTKQKFAAQTVLTVHNDARGQRRYSGIFSNTGPSSDTLLAWPGFERLDSPQRDVSGGEPARAALQDPRATYRAQLLQLLTKSEEELQQPQTRFDRALALFQTDQAELAIVELDWLAENLSTPNASVLQFRALTLAQLGRVEDAVAAFNAFQQTKPTASFVDYVSIQLTAWRKDAAAVRTAIDTATTTHQQNPNDLYNIACAAALAGRAFRRQAAADEAAEFSTRALQLLRQAIEGGYADLQNLLNDVDFADLHDNPEFLSLVSRLQPPDRFAGLWFADPALESRLLQAATPELLMQEAKGLLAENWRPVSVVSDSTNQQASAVLLLQRRLIPDPDSVALANQQAAAATALLRLDAADRVWPLLQDSPDPTVRSLIQQRLPRYGVDAGTLLQQLQNETDVGRRRMLILGLGELAKAELIPESQRESLVQDLVKRCADDPDSGVHGAAEWTLRQLRAESQIAEIRAAFGTGTAVGDRRWYITKTRGDTKDSSGLSMAILDGRREFLMGSPLSEVERYGGADGRPNDELLHRRRIGRVYAIGMHEVTVAQFRAFRANHAFDRGYAKSDDAPANVITWYDAAAFCNWLSEQEGLSREQWCYDPEQQFSSGMQLKANFLELEGYRLPTESEWESAARGGTLTSRFFGSDRGLLPNYAWYLDNSKQQGMLPVGSLRPNPFGLFELYGNAAEWCQDEAVYFRSDRPFLADGPNSGAGGEVVDASSRVLRGGSFTYLAASLRSAIRNTYRPDYRGSLNGFRVSRTYNLPP